jgi:hypothetical protein
MVDVVQAAKADVATAKAAVTAEVVTVKAKVIAWLKAHIPHAIAVVTGWVVSHFGVLSYLVSKL